jgi:hypothetical protein
VVVYFTQLLPANNLNDHAKLRALVYQAIVDAPGTARVAPPARPIPGPPVMQH